MSHSGRDLIDHFNKPNKNNQVQYIDEAMMDFKNDLNALIVHYKAQKNYALTGMLKEFSNSSELNNENISLEKIHDKIAAYGETDALSDKAKELILPILFHHGNKLATIYERMTKTELTFLNDSYSVNYEKSIHTVDPSRKIDSMSSTHAPEQTTQKSIDPFFQKQQFVDNALTDSVFSTMNTSKEKEAKITALFNKVTALKPMDLGAENCFNATILLLRQFQLNDTSQRLAFIGKTSTLRAAINTILLDVLKIKTETINHNSMLQEQQSTRKPLTEEEMLVNKIGEIEKSLLDKGIDLKKIGLNNIDTPSSASSKTKWSF